MLVFGHGTLDAENLINSRESFAAVRATGADGVELDVRICADGALAVIHDPTFVDGRAVTETNVDDWPDDILLLRDALDLCAGMVVNIEVKNYARDVAFDPTERVTNEVVRLLESRAWSDRVQISCFGLGCLDRILELRPELVTAHLVLSRRPAVEVIRSCVAHGHRAINPYISMVDRDFMSVARAHGLAVNVWSGFDEDESTLTDLLELRVDGVITAHPARAIRLRDGLL